MRQFDVYPNPSESSRAFAPFVVVLQSHHLPLDTVVVAPLVTDKISSSVEPAITIEEHAYVLALTELASIERTRLRGKRGDLTLEEDVIRRALNRVFTGF